MEWFAEVLRAAGNLWLGVQEIGDESISAGSAQLAAQAGYKVA